ncbi:MAG: hypothetical protein V4735_09590 [Pseudomonadota bacterium]
MASAADVTREGKDWRDCTEDAQCVLVSGPCNPTSVNLASKDVAAAYYKQQAKTARCVERFWEPKLPEAQCRLGSCSTAAKSAKKK